MYTNTQTQRHKLHHQLIDIENKPCATRECHQDSETNSNHYEVAEI